MTEIEIVLLSLLSVQQIYYMWQIQKLVNKVMSGNYFEYKQAETYRPKERKKQVQEEVIPDTTGSLQGLF